MKIKSIFVFLASCSLLSFSFWFFIKNKKINLVYLPYIKPPLKGLNVEYKSFNIIPSRDTVINYASGTKIKIPANAFIDSKGKVINESIILKYREFNDAIDIFLSGIPMTYDSLGKQYQFESAGMFEILAYKNKEAVFANASFPIIVELASDQAENRFNNYYLDTIKQNWQYIADIKQLVDSNSNDQKGISNRVTNANRAVWPATEPVKANSKQIFDIDFDKSEFPELAGYEGVKFEVADDEKSYDANLSNKTWESVKIEKHRDDLTYVVTFMENNESHSFKVKPVFVGLEYTKAKKKYDQLYSDYNNELNQKSAKEKTKQKLIDSIYSVQRSVIETTNKYATLSAYEQGEKTKTEQNIKRIFTISKFGIWNSDCPISLPTGQPRFAYFKDSKKNKLEFDHVFLIEKGKKALFNYYSDQFKKFQYNSSSENILIAVTKDNQVAIFSITDFEKLKNTKRRPDNDNLSFADSDSVRFIMNVNLTPIKNAEALKSLINI